MAEVVINPAERWVGTIATYEREFKKWETRVEKILKKYRGGDQQQGAGTQSAKFNILWSNVRVAVPAVFSRLPQPDVSRRHRDNDPVGRVAALILERGLEFEVNHYPDFRAAMRNCVQDRYLGGRGTSWVRYEPVTKPLEADGEPGEQITEDADAGESVEAEEPQEELDYECAPTDYVHWKDFGHTIARTWAEVTAVWRKVYMGREALVDRFGEEGEKVPLDTKPKDLNGNKDTGDNRYEALIYEIWDKSSKSAIWLSKSLGKILDEKPDPLKLENFWPCPRPLFATLTSDSLIPVPDYTLYQDQATILDVLEDRIEGLIKALQVKGTYDASIPELARLFTEAQGSDCQLLPVKNWQAFAEKNGLAGAISLVDLRPIAAALKECYAAVQEQKNQVYEITGLADIIRGSTDPRETAAAQKEKGRFGSMPLRSQQQDVAQFATELLQIKAQIMCGQFEPQTLAAIGSVETLNQADQQYVGPALELLKNATLRDFRIDVASDSMIQMDEQQEKEDRAEFLNAVGTYIEKVQQLPPTLAPLGAELLKFGVTGFKVGKTLEGSIDQLIDQLKAQAAKPQQQPQDPKIAQIEAKKQADMAVTQAKTQADIQATQAEQQAQAQQEQMRQQSEAQLKQLEFQLNERLANLEAALEMQLKQADAQSKMQQAQQTAALRPPPGVQ